MVERKAWLLAAVSHPCGVSRLAVDLIQDPSPLPSHTLSFSSGPESLRLTVSAHVPGGIL